MQTREQERARIANAGRGVTAGQRDLENLLQRAEYARAQANRDWDVLTAAVADPQRLEGGERCDRGLTAVGAPECPLGDAGLRARVEQGIHVGVIPADPGLDVPTNELAL